ncbi:vasotab-like isoform X1 [Drosophila innubila]|uniref:vasotab-like isoform X1 n=1 Tax=Drosophila innubila TaxID=198719 RepID=UPI00148E1053|nr:vasotab-like isoform X1 [Drosophila innubila]
MKLCVALISLLFCCSVIMAQSSNCPDVCPAIFSPVCGEATVGGQRVRCQFSNGCAMSGSGCRNKINWLQTSCGYGTSPTCGSLI